MAKKRGRKVGRKAKRAVKSAASQVRRQARRFWHQGAVSTVLSLYLLYLVYLYLTNRPLPTELASLCTTVWVRGLMLLLLVAAIFNRDVPSSALLFVSYFFTCWLASRNPWEFMDNKMEEDDESPETRATMHAQ